MKFKFIIVSKDTQHCFKREDFDKFQNVNYFFIENNLKGLPALYNEFIQSEIDMPESDFIVFMHGDVKFDINKLLNHVVECKDKYDVCGLAGTETLNVSQKPLNWWTGSNPTPEKRWGCVTHGELGNAMSFFSHHHPNVLDHAVACIDGLCIIFNRKAIESGMKFDERFDFNQYDTDISLQCNMKYNLSLGVLVHTELQHYSVGRGILMKSFMVGEDILRKKWNIQIN